MPTSAPPLKQWLKAPAHDALTGTMEQLDRDVHAARVQCKRLRAWLRLVRPWLMKDDYRKANALVRDAAAALAEQRRMQALREVCDTLQKTHAAQHWDEIAARLPGPETATANVAEARDRLGAFQRLLDDLSLPPATPKQLAQSLQSEYRRCRRDMKAASAEPTAERLHEWRKHTKAHGYQCRMMAPLWPELRQRRKRMRRLWNALGTHHDLHELQLELERHPSRYRGCSGGDDDRLRWIDAHLRRLQADALARGHRLFSRKPAQWWRKEISPPT